MRSNYTSRGYGCGEYNEQIFVDSKACPVLDAGTLKPAHSRLRNDFSNVAIGKNQPLEIRSRSRGHAKYKEAKMKSVVLMVSLVLFSVNLSANEIQFNTNDNAIIFAKLQKRGPHAILLAHGAIFNKESWGVLEKHLLENNYTVLAIDFRGYGKSTKGERPNDYYQDVLAGIEFLKQQPGISKVSVLGASMGGSAATKAAVFSDPEDITKLVLLSPARVYKPEELTGDILFIASEDEYLATALKSVYSKAPKPKLFKLIPGSAHAQHIFKTPQADALTRIILDFLNN
ncbi:alpha/beta hydrolase [Methyloprofundus sp.]|uniref:alpha/beta hydrolase n=1 Tax=Methyloprofundus sp. TaxID=2020875 RepID=UPI003D0D6896